MLSWIEQSKESEAKVKQIYEKTEAELTRVGQIIQQNKARHPWLKYSWLRPFSRQFKNQAEAKRAYAEGEAMLAALKQFIQEVRNERVWLEHSHEKISQSFEQMRIEEIKVEKFGAWITWFKRFSEQFGDKDEAQKFADETKARLAMLRQFIEMTRQVLPPPWQIAADHARAGLTTLEQFLDCLDIIGAQFLEDFKAEKARHEEVVKQAEADDHLRSAFSARLEEFGKNQVILHQSIVEIMAKALEPSQPLDRIFSFMRKEQPKNG